MLEYLCKSLKNEIDLFLPEAIYKDIPWQPEIIRYEIYKTEYSYM